MSSFVFSIPKVILNAPCANLYGKPIEVSTCDGSIVPEVHAEPLEAHIPFISNLYNNSSPSIPSKDILLFPGSLLILSPLIFIYGILFSICCT